MDEDWFSFHTDGGLVSFRADVAGEGVGNLHAELRLYRVPLDDGVAMLPLELVEDSDPESPNNPPTDSNADWSAEITREVPSGTYVIAVRSFGGYGDIGTYALTGTIQEVDVVVAGDSNHDGAFNTSDLVEVFRRGEYEDGIAGNSTFEDGDWNGDDDFDSSDLVFVFQGRHVRSAGTSVRRCSRHRPAICRS